MMVIRVLLEKLDREKEHHQEAIKRLEDLKAEILHTCRGEAAKGRQARKGAPCHDQGEARRAA